MAHDRYQREIEHGKFLKDNNAEALWGWGSKAGMFRERRRANLIIEKAQLHEGMHVLEIGCGTGHFTELFAKTGATIVAVDISPELLGLARLRNINNAVFINKPFEHCENIGPFDAIIGSSVLHHLDIDVALPTILSMLKPNGVICFAEPNMMNPQVFVERHFRSIFSYVSPDETAFVFWILQRKLRNIGFLKAEITPFDWLHPATPERLIPVISKFGLFLESFWPVKHFSGSLLIHANGRS